MEHTSEHKNSMIMGERIKMKFIDSINHLYLVTPNYPIGVDPCASMAHGDALFFSHLCIIVNRILA